MPWSYPRAPCSYLRLCVNTSPLECWDPELPPLPDFSAPDKAGRSEDGLSRFDGCCSLVCLLAPACMDCWQVTMLSTAWRITTQLLISPWHCRLPGRNAHMCVTVGFPVPGFDFGLRCGRRCASSSPPLCPRCVAAPQVGDSDTQEFSAGRCGRSCGRRPSCTCPVSSFTFTQSSFNFTASIPARLQLCLVPGTDRVHAL